MFRFMDYFLPYAEMCEKLYDLEITILRLCILESKSCWRVANIDLFLLLVQEVVNKYHWHLRKIPSVLSWHREAEC